MLFPRFTCLRARIFALTGLGLVPALAVLLLLGGRPLLRSHPAAFALVALLTLAVAWIAGDAIVLRPVRLLLAAIERVGSGDLGARTGLPHGRSEFGTLAAAFDRMAASLEQAAAERRRAEKALRESEERHRRFVEEDPTGDFVVTAEGRLLFCNPAFVAMFGFASAVEAMGTNVVSLYPRPEARGELLALLSERRRLASQPMEMRRRDGATLHVIAHLIGEFDGGGNLTEIRGYLLDDTDRTNLERQVFQTQKIESIGTLAGGVAHDFNNILTAILGYSELALLDLPDDSPARDSLAQIVQLCVQAARLTSQLLALSRKTVTEKKPLDLAPLVQDMAKVLQRVLPESIAISFEAPHGPYAVEADATQMQQVVMNLCVNARDAMPEGGELRMALDAVTLGPGHGQPFAGARPGNYVRLTVRDTGVGMTPEVQRRLFEPFFTTKEPGRGTGLGLAVVYGIARAHDGFVHAQGQPGQGSEFQVYLPACRRVVGGVEAQPQDPARGSETVLLVEDQPEARAVTEALLQRLGYRVLTATDGEEALEVFDRHREEIAVVLSDLVMPKMGGPALARAVRARGATCPFLILTGYAHETEPGAAAQAGVSAFLHKPLTVVLLAEGLRVALEGTEGSADVVGGRRRVA